MSKQPPSEKTAGKNTSFLQIPDDIQKERALTYLRSDTISNKETS